MITIACRSTLSSEPTGTVVARDLYDDFLTDVPPYGQQVRTTFRRFPTST
jgi:hypothetical protein